MMHPVQMALMKPPTISGLELARRQVSQHFFSPKVSPHRRLENLGGCEAFLPSIKHLPPEPRNPISSFLSTSSRSVGLPSSPDTQGDEVWRVPRTVPVSTSRGTAGRNSQPMQQGLGDVKEEEFLRLKVSEIKTVLDAGGVDYRDCLEKRELVERLQQSYTYIPRSAQRLLRTLLRGEARSGAGAGGSMAFMDMASEEEGMWLEVERNTIQRFQECGPSVVHVETIATARGGIMALNQLEIPRGSGSGFIWDTEGHIVTNYHVVMALSHGAKARVTLSDGTACDAVVVGAAMNTDIAVLKIVTDKKKLKPISVGTSQDLQVGQHVLAIGNPFGLDRTLTAGIVSGVGRDIQSFSGRTIKSVIQTDAAINPGNSGGPLLDSRGRLIGVNTAIYSPSGASAGVGFAIPVDTVRRVVNQLIREGRVTRPALGISMAHEGQARQLGITAGMLVLGVQPGGPADKAGIRGSYRDEFGRMVLGDVITAVNGEKISKTEDLICSLEEQQVGAKVRVTVKRGGSLRDIYVTLEESSD